MARLTVVVRIKRSLGHCLTQTVGGCNSHSLPRARVVVDADETRVRPFGLVVGTNRPAVEHTGIDEKLRYCMRSQNQRILCQEQSCLILNDQGG